MSLTPAGHADLAQQRALVRKARAQGRQWILRAMLLAVVAGVALVRGGAFNLALGTSMVLLAVIAVAMGLQLRRQAADIEQKIDLMQHTTSDELGEISG